VLTLPTWANAVIVSALAVASFASFKFLHPFRVERLRAVSIAAVIAWAALAMITVVRELVPGPWVVGGLVAIGLYFLAVGLTARSPS
jgi:phosphatidylcholine synthase